MTRSLFCANCGTPDLGDNQYCRSCGADLRAIRTAVESPELVLNSSYSAKYEIGKAFADRIRRADRKDLKKISDEILPEVEKFLESPEEKRLRRMRTGWIMTLIGLGAAIGFAIVSGANDEPGILTLSAFGLVALFIGAAFILNGYFLSVPGEARRERRREGKAETISEHLRAETNELLMPASANDEFVASVTEETTRNLKREARGDRRRETGGRRLKIED